MNANHERALRAIAAGARTLPKFRTATSAVAWPAMRVSLQELVEAGHVSRGRGSVLSLTTAGRALITPATPPVAMKPYVPPQPMARRAGADDWQRIPSIAGDQKVLKAESKG